MPANTAKCYFFNGTQPNYEQIHFNLYANLRAKPAPSNDNGFLNYIFFFVDIPRPNMHQQGDEVEPLKILYEIEMQNKLMLT